ncbi:MAG TPA: HD domain-containing protein [Bacteroidetes bacterium]|nr:HD domain-containing protein [Bacteroidota bacterium]
MNKKKIFNDPLYGLIGFDHKIIYDLIDHPIFQRLRRIKQMGLADYVYPSANHTRFSHSLGATYLMKKSIETLIWKGIIISDEEYKAATIAILLHDIGHSPFSHSLEKVFLPYSHEDITLELLGILNDEFDGQLDVAIKMFENKYEKKFFHQLISSQLDVDRLDYLNRDSYFTGVAEGVIGYDRIIKMLNVVDDKLVVEEKGIYSIEKFLMARNIMYWQVYMHKTSLVVDKMLEILLEYVYNEAKDQDFNLLPHSLQVFKQKKNKSELLKAFLKIDDSDVVLAIKNLTESNDQLIKFLTNGLLNRKLLKIKLKNSEINGDSHFLNRHRNDFTLISDERLKNKLFISGKISNDIYDSSKGEEIFILTKNNEIQDISEMVNFLNSLYKNVKYFVIYI